MGWFPGLGPLLLTVKLAALTTIVLLLIGTPLAWWLANTRIRFKPFVEAVVALPVVLPPTVIGFYLLILLGPQGWIGRWWVQLSGATLTFTFTGLVIASVVYSFPFVVQPLQSAFESVGMDFMEAARTLGANRFDAFFSIAVPLARRGFLTATVLGFAHTLGEFGVVLMVGGNIPGVTRTISIDIYDRVQTGQYSAANQTALLLLIVSFVVLSIVFGLNRYGQNQRTGVVGPWR